MGTVLVHHSLETSARDVLTLVFGQSGDTSFFCRDQREWGISTHSIEASNLVILC